MHRPVAEHARGTPDVTSEILVVTTLGIDRIAWHGAPIDVPSTKLRALIAYLAVQAIPMHRDDLAELLWSFHPRRRQSLRQALHALSKLPGAEQWLVKYGRDRVAVMGVTDVASFDTELRHGEIDAATARYHGRFLEHWGAITPSFDEWRLDVQRQTEERYLDALHLRLERLMTTGAWKDVRSVAEHLLAHDEFDERACYAAMLASLELEGRHAALRRFERFERRMRRDMGHECAEDLIHLAVRIRNDAPTSAPFHVATRVGQQDGRRDVRLIERDALLENVDAAWRQDQLVLLAGAPGTGKSALVDWLASQRPSIVLRPPSTPTDVAYVGLTNLVHLLETAAPHVMARQPRDGWLLAYARSTLDGRHRTDDPDLAHARIAAELAVLLRDADFERFLLLIDDLDKMDAPSRTVLLSALTLDPARLPAGSVAVTIDDRPSSPRFRDEVASLAARGGAVRLDVKPLSRDGVARMLDAHEALPASATRDVDVASIHAFTGGNPLLLRELIEEVRASAPTRSVVSLRLAERSRSILHRRLARLAAEDVALLRVMAVARTEQDAFRLAAALGREEDDVVRGLERVTSLGIVQNGWFRHGAWRRAILDDLPTPTARYLHRSWAQALVDVEEPEGVEARAYHLCHTGELDRAAACYLAAARHALSVNAVSAALEQFFRAAWSAGHARGGSRHRAEALVGVHRLALRLRDGLLAEQAIATLDVLANASQDDHVLFLAHLLRSESRMMAGAFEEAYAEAEDAAAIATRRRDEGYMERASLQLGACCTRLGRIDEARMHFHRAERATDAMVRMRALGNLGAIAGVEGAFEDARRYSDAALTAAREGGTLNQIAALLNNDAATAQRSGAYERAVRQLTSSMELHERVEDATNKVVAIANRADVLLKLGRFDAALEDADMAIRDALRVASSRTVLQARLLRALVVHEMGDGAAALDAFDVLLTEHADLDEDRLYDIARFNAARVRVLYGTGDVKQLMELLDALQAPQYGDVAAWSRAEVALLTGTDDVAAPPVLDAPNVPDHLALLWTLAEALTDHRAGRRPVVARLRALHERLDVAESPLVDLVLARSMDDRSSADAHAERAHATIERQLGRFPVEVRARRLGLLERIMVGMTT